ncbi:acyl carrier protein [Pseudomonas sp. FSL R10-1350]|uniref:acyl carrier protein n=1 Tax=Pseudomonas TaxID=286 RepID=UPI0012973669|nr:MULTISPECIES: acyl carrier protein [unclassified Pseudomonas]MQT58767.1 acyl carrier protein [Pseudomonas sp. FSL R10-0399]MQU62764.1 acyl carrier protein [Pseudomonas sp. FSL R10-1350]
MQEKILSLIEEAMEADEGTVSLDDTLADLAWDSIAVVTFMALADERLDKTLSAEKLNECVKVSDIVALITI